MNEGQADWQVAQSIPARATGPRVSLRRSGLLELSGRAVIVVAAALATTHVDSGNRVVWSLVLGAIWLLCIQAGFAANANELLALGTPVAATRGTILGLVTTSAFAAWLTAPRFDPSRLLLCAAIVLVLVMAWQEVVRRVTPARRILVVGVSGAGQDIARELQAIRRTPFELIGFVTDGGALDADVESPIVGEIGQLSEIIHGLRPSIIVVAVERNRPAIFEPLLESADAGFRVVEAAQFSEHAFGRVPVRDIQRAWFMSVLHLYQRPYSRVAKRAFDILVGTLGLLISLPLLPILFLVVRLTPGPVLLRQERMGEFGRPFTMYKFRTMRSDAESGGEAIWAQERDPRVTAAGRVMRRVRLDEIPQLWNVIRGDMSIVGPRPERPEFMHFLEQRVPFWSHRQLVKPGITGWAQVRRGYTSDAEGSIDKLSYDLWYLRHRSIVVDLAICLRTLWVLVVGTPSEMTARRLADRSDVAETLPVWGGNPPQSATTTNTP